MQAQPASQPAAIEEDLPNARVDEILAEHGGDARRAIGALLQKVSYLEAARDRALALVSFGYARGKLNG